MIAFIVVPTNTSLMAYRQKALEELSPNTSQRPVENSDILEFRGEDVPLAIYGLASLNKKAIGLTGEDIFRDFLLKKRNSDLIILKKLVWEDSNALFGKPALCLLGPRGKTLADFPKGRELRVGISSKYKELAKKYLNKLEAKGCIFRKMSINGQCETAVTSGLADLAIDIVYTGKSMKEAGLEAYEKIFTSDFVIIGSKRFWRQNGAP